MTDTEITALSREYAEEVYRNAHKEMEVLPNCLSNEAINMFAEDMESKLKWLLRRYCLVEKSKIREAYKDAQKDQHNSGGDFALTLAGRNRSAVLIDLFPEIANEVE